MTFQNLATEKKVLINAHTDFEYGVSFHGSKNQRPGTIEFSNWATKKQHRPNQSKIVKKMLMK